MAKLVITLEEGGTREIPLERERLTIGRAPHNDVVIDHSGVSAEHAMIVAVRDDVLLQDLGSTNGTTVNGQPVMRHFLQDQDLIELADCAIRYCEVGESDLHEEEGKPPHPRIRILSGASAGKVYALKKSVTTIGRFGGEVAAIMKGEEGLTFLHIEGDASPWVNGDPIREEIRRLKHEDILQVSGTRLQILC